MNSTTRIACCASGALALSAILQPCDEQAQARRQTPLPVRLQTPPFPRFTNHAADFFMGDDFELIGDALAGVSPWEPVSTHLRPIVRLHFRLYRWIPSPAFFGALSILLHR